MVEVARLENKIVKIVSEAPQRSQCEMKGGSQEVNCVEIPQCIIERLGLSACETSQAALAKLRILSERESWPL